MKVVLRIRFSSWNPVFQREKRIPETTLITAQSLWKRGRDEGCLGGPLFPQRLCFVFPHIWLFFSALRGSHVFRAQRQASTNSGLAVACIMLYAAILLGGLLSIVFIWGSLQVAKDTCDRIDKCFSIRWCFFAY